MAALGIARESEYFHSAQRVALSKHVGKLVDGGLLPQSALAALEGANPNAVVHSSGIPTTIRRKPPAEFVYNHVQSLFPSEQLPHPAFELRLGEICADGWRGMYCQPCRARVTWWFDPIPA